jgi:signal transduction histidine kinase
VRADARWLQRLLVLGALLATFPTPGSLLDAAPRLSAPLDSSLRVPLTAALLGSGLAGLELEDRVLAVSSVPTAGWRAPKRRSELAEWLSRRGAGELELELARRSDRVHVRAAVEETTGARRVLRDAPTFVAGFLLLVLALALPRSPAHPAVPPLFAVCCASGALLLSQLDVVLPEAPSLVPLPGVRGRLAALAFMLLPASLIHLAARFPGPVARLPGAAVLPYVCWGLAATFAQVHLENAALRNVLDRIAAGAGVGAIALILIGLVASTRGRRPIERARAWAFVTSLLVAAGLVAAALLGSPGHSRWIAATLVLALLVFPSAIAGSILRYGLAPAPPWWSSLSSALRPIARRRSERRRALNASLDGFASAASEAQDWRAVREALLEVVGRLLRPEACTAVDLSGRDFAAALGRDGLALWRSAGMPRAPVRVSSRRRDPSAECAELVVPILPTCGRRLLVVLSGRRDGLPWGPEHEALLQGFAPVTATALDAVAKRAELTRRVVEKTRTLRRAVEDRERLLCAARKIGEAESADEVHAVLSQLCEGAGRSEGSGALAVSVRAPSGASRLVAIGGVDRVRARELRPQLETAAAFAELAMARLELLAELKREVERQAGELAESRSRRLHAEFVRGVAHELRKPLEELTRRVDAVGSRAIPELGADLAAAAHAGSELSRRLDLLLVHSGLRLDLQRVDLLALAREKLASARRLAPDRTFALDSELQRLPLIGDPCRLASVLENLLDNAVRATLAGQRITVRARLEASRLGRELAVLEVVDPGCGIPAARRRDIFEPGVSLIPGGFGLGLSLCRQIVKMHGGTLDVASRPGRTVFRATLPQIGRAEGAEEAEDGN